MESEMATVRRELGRSPSLVASRAEENQVLEDLRKMGGGTVSLKEVIVGKREGGIVGGEFELLCVVITVLVMVLFVGLLSMQSF